MLSLSNIRRKNNLKINKVTSKKYHVLKKYERAYSSLTSERRTKMKRNGK